MPPQAQNQQQPQKQPPKKDGAKGAPKSIEGFDPKTFAKNLAIEASQVIPNNIQDVDKKFIVDIVHKFCYMCGEALARDEKLALSASQASMITQFIGEWTFHKSVDLINGGISPDLREGVLQKVAFTVFEVAKQAISRNVPQNQTIQIIEHHVKNAFKNAIEDLKNKGKLNDDVVQNTLNQSSIDAMSQQQFEEERGIGDDLSDAKILKLASLALLVKKLPQEKVNKLIEKLNQSEAQVLTQYLKMPNLEQKIDKGIIIKGLEEIKNVLPEPKNLSMDRLYLKLFKIVKTCDKKQISNIIDNERPVIKQFVLSPYTKDEVRIPVRIGNVICKYLEEQLSENENDNQEES